MDQELRLQILKAVVRDHSFLKQSGRDVDPSYFSLKEESLIVTAALDFYNKFEEPIGAMLPSEVEELAEGARLNKDSKRRLDDLIASVMSRKHELVSVAALSTRLRKLKKAAFFDKAVDDLLIQHEKGELTARSLSDLVELAQKELSDNDIVVRDYMSPEALENRIAQRSQNDDHNFLPIFVPPLDHQIKMLGRGELGIFLAPPAGGKGLALLWVAMAYARQGKRVLHVTLEDPIKLVEQRLDAAITMVPLSRLKLLPNRTRNQFLDNVSKIKGRIRTVDGTGGGMTVTKLERLVERERRSGFPIDAVIIDYDDDIECEKQFKGGDSVRRQEFSEIYKRLLHFAANSNVFLWTAAQTTRAAEDAKVITNKHAAEDFSKIRKAFLAITISLPFDKDAPNKRFLYVAKARESRSRFGVEIVSDYDSAIFYDHMETELLYKVKKKRMLAEESERDDKE